MEDTTPAPKEESIFEESDFSIKGYDKHLRRARNNLFWLGGLILLLVYRVFPLNNDPARVFSAGSTILMGGSYIALGFWAKKKPFSALVTALCIFTGNIVVGAILQPASLLTGIFFKIAIILVLVSGLDNARDCQRMMEQAKQIL